MVVAAHPLAAEAGREILRQGGNAVDAAIATALVLNLVEPQSSGVGGGGFLVYYAAAHRELVTIDGRETAPLAAKPDRFLNPDGTPMHFFTAVVGGRSIGTPGYLRMLEMAHRKFGKLPWSSLFLPAIKLATDGFPVSERLHMLLAQDPFLPKSESAKGYFYHADGTPLAAGEIGQEPAARAHLHRSGDARRQGFLYAGRSRATSRARCRDATPAGDMSHRRSRALSRQGAQAGLRPLSRLARLRHGAAQLGRRSRCCKFSACCSVSRRDQLDLVRPGACISSPRPASSPSPTATAISPTRILCRRRSLGLLDPGYLASRAKLIDPERDNGVPAQPGDPPRRHAERAATTPRPNCPRPAISRWSIATATRCR